MAGGTHGESASQSRKTLYHRSSINVIKSGLLDAARDSDHNLSRAGLTKWSASYGLRVTAHTDKRDKNDNRSHVGLTCKYITVV